MNRLSIRKTELNDVPRLMDIYEVARGFMKNHGNPHQWSERNWPPQELILADIAKGNSFVCENEGNVVGTFYYEYGKDDPTYINIEDGSWLCELPYGVVHRIASDGSIKGIGTYCINWAYEQSHHLRIDTHGDNIVMQNLLNKLGFTKCGVIYVKEDNYPRIAYEKWDDTI